MGSMSSLLSLYSEYGHVLRKVICSGLLIEHENIAIFSMVLTSLCLPIVIPGVVARLGRAISFFIRVAFTSHLPLLDYK